MRVDFVIGGTQKSGTSALSAFLSQHPEICMPAKRKELHYFDNDRNFQGIQALDPKAYEAQFKPTSNHKIAGESTPIYLYWETAIPRIWQYNPSMKWIVLLRNPVQRAFSAWSMEHARGRDSLPFHEAVALETTRCREALPLQHRTFAYLDRGLYSIQIRRLLRFFPRENSLFLLSEDLLAHHERTLKEVFQFLQVDAGTKIAAANVFSTAYTEVLDPKLAKRLATYFYHDLRTLEVLIGRNLSDWYTE